MDAKRTVRTRYTISFRFQWEFVTHIRLKTVQNLISSNTMRVYVYFKEKRKKILTIK